MLRIAVITRYFPSVLEPWQGRSAYETLRVLARHADVRVFHATPANPAGLKRERHPSAGKVEHVFSSAVNASYYRFSALPIISRPFNGDSLVRAVYHDVRSFAPDVVLGCFVYPDGYAAVKIGQALSIPSVVMALGSDINNIRDPFTRRHTRWAISSADFVVTVSDDLRQKSCALGARPETTRAVINGCDLSVFHVRSRTAARGCLRIDSSAKVVVYLGRLDVRKGLRELVQSALMLHPLRRDVHTYMVGEGPDRKVIQDQIDAARANSYIHLKPSCRFDEVALWMAASDLVTLPSYMEGCPNVVIEALASGRPVVATAVGGIPEILDDQCGQLVRPKEPRELARAIVNVLDRDWQPEQISALCSRSWESVAEELFEVFRNLVPDRWTIRTWQQMNSSSVAIR